MGLMKLMIRDPQGIHRIHFRDRKGALDGVLRAQPPRGTFRTVNKAAWSCGA